MEQSAQTDSIVCAASANTDRVKKKMLIFLSTEGRLCSIRLFSNAAFFSYSFSYS